VVGCRAGSIGCPTNHRHAPPLLADTLPASLPNLLAALAAGLVIGLERGWRDRELADGERVAGLRTFAMLGLLGGVFQLVHPWLLAAGALGLAGIAAVAYREAVRSSGNLSATSVVAQLLTYGLGALATGGAPLPAVGLAVVAATLLDLRPTLHRWLRLIEHQELSAALQLLVLSAVVLPLLPDAPFGPYGALNPYRLWWAVVLVAGLSLSGHVAMRAAGDQRGALWTGLLGGLASSTAATLALARRQHDRPDLLAASSAGALSACAVMFLRIALVLVAMAPVLARLLLAPLLVAGGVLFAVALLQWRQRGPAGAPGQPSSVPPFDLATALGFGAFLGLMAVLSEASKQWLGAGGLYGLALVSGLVDVDAITISVARMGAQGSVALPVAAGAVALAVLSNMVVKVALAWATGSAALGRRVAGGYLIAVAASAAVLAATLRAGG
jgi:uncharacterized membrane protein (DUF4010 family)